MSKLWKSVTLAAVAGLWASSALAAPVDFTNTTTRLIAVLSEDSNCEARTAMTAPFPFPNNIPPDPGCTVFQNSGSAVYNDASSVGPNDLKATLSKVTCTPGGLPNDCSFDDGNWWRLDVSPADEFKVIKRTVDKTPGAVVVSATGNGILFNISSGEVKPPSGTIYYSAALTYPSIGPLDLFGKAVLNDAPFFGTSNDLVGALATSDVALTFSCAGSLALAASNPALPGLGPWWNGGAGGGGPGGANAICGAGPFPAQPGFNTVSMSGMTAFVASSIEFAGPPANDPTTSPAWGGFDYKFEEAVDPDGDGVVSGATTLEKQFILDNCKFEGNGLVSLCTGVGVPWLCCTGPTAGATCDQSDVGGLGTAPPDLIGDACQCGDNNNDGKVTASDSTNLKRALLNLSTRFSVGGNAACTGPAAPVFCCSGPGTGTCDPGLLPAGLNKCNVGTAFSPGIPGCTASDATTISRALLNLTVVNQKCDAQQ
jgi:hypothetical protein